MEIQTTSTKTTDDGEIIPDWFVYELLLRLPLNCVFAFRLVSKLWLSTASDPHFIRAYASRAISSRPPYWTVLSPRVSVTSRSVHRAYIMPPELYLRPRLCEIRLPPDFESHDSEPELVCIYFIVGASDGLVSYCPIGLLDFYICNPITGHWIRACEPAPQPRPSHPPFGFGFLTRVDEEFVLRSFRIVQIACNKQEHKSSVLIFSAYHSETRRWETHTVAMGRQLGVSELRLQLSAAALDGLLYWAEVNLGVIVCDPEANQTWIIPHPRLPLLSSCACAAYRGELRYVGGYSGQFPCCRIWRLVEGGGSWCIMYKIAIRAITVWDAEDVVFHPCDPDVMLHMCTPILGGYYRAVFSYNFKSRAFEQRRGMIVEDGGPFCLKMLWRRMFYWNPLLVLPPWPTRLEKYYTRKSPLADQINEALDRLTRALPKEMRDAVIASRPTFPTKEAPFDGALQLVRGWLSSLSHFKGRTPVEGAPRDRGRPRRGKGSKRRKIRAGTYEAEEKASLSIVVTFVDGTPLPSVEEVVEFYQEFGILNAEKTKVFPHLHTALVAYENKDAEIERALESSVRGSSSFRVERAHRCWMRPKRKQVGDGNSGKADGVAAVIMEAVREKLETIAAKLDKHHSQLTDEGKDGLMKEVVGNLMEMAEEVEKLVDDVDTSES